MMVTTGAVVSTVTVWVAAVLVLPAGSVAVTRTMCAPSLSSAAVTVQVPSEATVGVKLWLPTLTVMVAPPLVVPVMVGVTSLVNTVEPPMMVTTGAVVSTVTVWVAEPTLPAGSVTEATTVCTPSVRVGNVTTHTWPV